MGIFRRAPCGGPTQDFCWLAGFGLPGSAEERALAFRRCNSSSAMTVTSGSPSRGPVAIFDLIANFLDKCQFRSAADAIRVQRDAKEFVLEADFAKNFRGLVDSSALLLSELETLAYFGEPQKAPEEEEVVLEHIVDGLLRKLMAAGHSLSDQKLNNSIDCVLSNDMFNKLTLAEVALKEGALDQPLVLPGDNLGISNIDVNRYWEQIQKESAVEVLKDAGGAGDSGAGDSGALPSEVPEGTANAGAADPQQAAGAPQQFGGQLEPPAPSSHYRPRRPRGANAADEDWDEDDEYHDDDDPGYRIREIYEAELLAELSAKAVRAPREQNSRGEVTDELADCAAPEGSLSPGAAAESEKPPAAPSVTVAFAAGEEVGTEAAKGGTDTKAIAEAGSPKQAEEVRSASPTFGGTATGEEPAVPAPAVPAAEPTAPSFGREAEERAKLEETERLRAQEDAEKAERYARQKKLVKYAASGDPFYPVELEGVVYDSFGLRIVFERDKTGFEESKEFPIRVNSVVAARYQILEYLGSAAFSRAVQCLDLETNKMVCMKIIKNDKDFFDQSLDEIKLLKYINVNGDVDENNVLRLFDYFYHKEHLIIVTELLRDNLYEFSKFNRECGDEPYFTLGRLQKIAKQCLTALDYVHSLRLIHCDLKPENILIRSYSRCEVKVIDFGSSCFVDDHLSSYVQSRSYRAPEVMLGLPYDQKIDLWSLGCILAELWTGYVLFQNDSVQSLLARVFGIVGEFPYHLMTRGRYVPQYFTQDGQLYQEIDGPSCPERGRRLHLLVPKKSSLAQRMRTDSPEFLDFLTQLLMLDPSKRPTAGEALQHPWLTQCKYSDGL